MASPEFHFPQTQFVSGLQIATAFRVENFHSALHYRPPDGDVFLVTYPKCGTTWAQHILFLIFTKGIALTHDRISQVIPFIDMTGAKAAEDKPRPGGVKTHLPFHLVPWSEKAKYIYVARNPKDCCVSYYHHCKKIRTVKFCGSFDEFFEFFIAGDIDYGDYLDHLLGWYQHRNEPNVLFLTYEEMKKDPKAAILKMASFMDDELYAEPLRNDLAKLNDILKHSSFESMKNTVCRFMDDRFNWSKEDILKSDLPKEVKETFLTAEDPKKEHEEYKLVNLIRKGVIGDWRNYFSEEQSRRMNKKFAERTKGTDLGNYWKDCM